MPFFLQSDIIDCDGAAYFRAQCTNGGAAVGRIRSGGNDVRHVVIAGVVVPHVRYDLIVETYVNGNWNGQFGFTCPTTRTALGTWTTGRLLNFDIDEIQDSAPIYCQIVNRPVLVEIESVGKKLRRLDDPAAAWVDIKTDPFPLQVHVT